MLKTKDLIGPELDWYVAKLEGKPVKIINDMCIYVGPVDTWAPPGSLKGILVGQRFNPSVRHGIGGTIIERERIRITPWDRKEGEPKYKQWYASIYSESIESKGCDGPTYLIAAMRAYVLHKMGPEVPEIVDDYEIVPQVM